MIFEKWISSACNSLFTLGMALACLYHAMIANPFLNIASDNASGIEKAADTALIPFQYLFGGKTAFPCEGGRWRMEQRFSYDSHWIAKSVACALLLPSSLAVGAALKTGAYLATSYRDKYASIVQALSSQEVILNRALYEELGIKDPSEDFTPLGLQRRPGDEDALQGEKQALADIARLLTHAGIAWWVDCGTCLGAYRYGGAIPWDIDIDLAVLMPDFDNVWHALQALDPSLYAVQDWSGRDDPKSYIKVFCRKTEGIVDIYQFAIDREKKEIRYILSLENNPFLPKWWKIREQKFKAPIGWSEVFPLKRAEFDGIPVFVPRNIERYLQRYYGENLSPIRVFNEVTGLYEKDLAHPYWQMPHVH